MEGLRPKDVVYKLKRSANCDKIRDSQIKHSGKAKTYDSQEPTLNKKKANKQKTTCVDIHIFISVCICIIIMHVHR